MESAIQKILQNDSTYPPFLSEIQNPPRQIFFLGTFPICAPCVAIVGTRKATSEGKKIAYTIAEELSKRGFCIVSGLAFGIDEAAHEGALSGHGKTIAVLANGLDTVYPKQHEQLAKKILAAGGALISEYILGTPALPHQFLERNRIVSGISAATVVIEAPIRSGSIATARHAAEQGRDVFVFPGNHSHPNYRGSHALIRNGARLVASIEDILEDLGVVAPEKNTQDDLLLKKYKDDALTFTILQTLYSHTTPLTIDKLSELTTLEPRTLTERISLLTIEGVLKEDRNGGFIIASL